MALTKAVPPPATIPSCTAALVAFRASSILSFLSFISTSVAAPTLTTATPPDSLANLSANFSLSKSDVVSAICIFIWLILWAMSAFEPTPPTIVVVSLFTLTVWALPSISSWTSFRSKPNSVDTNLPPVRMARSSSMAFLLSPKAGAFTATTSNVPLSLLTTNVDRASPSRSSAMISSLPPC